MTNPNDPTSGGESNGFQYGQPNERESTPSYGSYGSETSSQPDNASTYGAPNQQAYGSGYGQAPGSNQGDLYPEFNGEQAGWALDQKKNPLAPWALGLGIAALVLTITVIGAFISWIVAIAGIVLGIVALVKAKDYGEDGKRKVFSIIGIVLSALSLLLIVGGMMGLAAIFGPTAENCEQHQDDPTAFQRCLEDDIEQRFGN